MYTHLDTYALFVFISHPVVPFHKIWYPLLVVKIAPSLDGVQHHTNLKREKRVEVNFRREKRL